MCQEKAGILPFLATLLHPHTTLQCTSTLALQLGPSHNLACSSRAFTFFLYSPHMFVGILEGIWKALVDDGTSSLLRYLNKVKAQLLLQTTAMYYCALGG